MQLTPAAITYARQRLGRQVMQRLLEEVAGPLAGGVRFGVHLWYVLGCGRRDVPGPAR